MAIKHTVEQLSGDSNAGKLDTRNSELVSRETIPGTPFTIVGTDQGYFLAMGQFRLTEYFETRDIVIDEIDAEAWNLVLQMITAVLNAEKRLENVKKEVGE